MPILGNVGGLSGQGTLVPGFSCMTKMSTSTVAPLLGAGVRLVANGIDQDQLKAGLLAAIGASLKQQELALNG